MLAIHLCAVYTLDCTYNSGTLSCTAPPAPENGAVAVSGVQPLVAQYSCEQGRTLVGYESRTCRDAAFWSYSGPTCRNGIRVYTHFV